MEGSVVVAMMVDADNGVMYGRDWATEADARRWLYTLARQERLRADEFDIVREEYEGTPNLVCQLRPGVVR